MPDPAPRRKTKEKLAEELWMLCERRQGYAFVSDGLIGRPRREVFSVARRTLRFQEALNRDIRKWLKENRDAE